MGEQAVSLSIVELFPNADIVVKGVLLILLAGSIWSWAVHRRKVRQFARERLALNGKMRWRETSKISGDVGAG